MKLSEQESKWLRRWEKWERQWVPMTRWICVFNGLGSVALGIMAIWLYHESRAQYTQWLIFVSLFFFAKAGLWFGITFSKWNGDIKLRLLLRLIREHEDKDS
jgi:hypothetical protein